MKIAGLVVVSLLAMAVLVLVWNLHTLLSQRSEYARGRHDQAADLVRVFDGGPFARTRIDTLLAREHDRLGITYLSGYNDGMAAQDKVRDEIEAAQDAVHAKWLSDHLQVWLASSVDADGIVRRIKIDKQGRVICSPVPQ